jgi:hypothetical protein
MAPVYIIMQASESMKGRHIVRAKAVADSLLVAMKSSPLLIESGHVCLIAHGGSAKVLAPLCALCQFDFPDIVELGGRPCVGTAISLFNEEWAGIAEGAVEEFSRCAPATNIWPATLIFIGNSDEDETMRGDLSSFLTINTAERFVVKVGHSASQLQAFLGGRRFRMNCDCKRCLMNRVICFDASGDKCDFGIFFNTNTTLNLYPESLLGDCPL